MFRLQTLGGLALLDASGAAVATQRRRLALLALLAVAGKRGLTRDKLVVYLWPESSAEHARHALEQLLYALRRQISEKLFLGTDPLRLNPEIIDSDVGQFDAALARGVTADAVAQYHGEFLDGVYLRGADDFERWTESQRSRLAADCRRALETLARAESEQGNYRGEVEWRRKLVALDPLGTQGALDLMRALVAAGDRAGALQFARAYEALLREELSSAPEAAVAELVQQLQSEGGAAISASAPPTPPSRRQPSDSSRADALLRTRLVGPATGTGGGRLWRKLVAVLGASTVVIGVMAVIVAREARSRPLLATSVAVLPFTNLGGSPEDEYFSDGMTEELITALSKIKGLHVAARTSTFTFKHRSVDAREIGRELHVGALVEAGVRRSGDRLRVTARLINAADGYQVWSEEYERDVRDVFAVEDEISRAIANALQVTLVERKNPVSVHRPTASPEAHERYMRGRQFFGLRADETSLRRSVESFESAIKFDSSYALAYSGLSDAYSVLSIWGFDPPQEDFPRAKAAARQALTLDSTLAEAHTSLGIVSMWFDLDGVAARRELTRAIAFDPRYPPAHLFYAWYLTSRGSTDSAVGEARLARDLDPLSVITNTRVGTMLFYAGRYEEALTQLQTTLELDSSNAMAHAELARVFVQLGRCGEALAAIRHLPASFPNVEGGVTGYVYAVCGRRLDAVRMLKDLEEQSRRRFVFASRIALLYVALGKHDEALVWLDRAITQRDPMSQALTVEPLYRPLRSDPRFHRLLVKAGLQHGR